MSIWERMKTYTMGFSAPQSNIADSKNTAGLKLIQKRASEREQARESKRERARERASERQRKSERTKEREGEGEQARERKRERARDRERASGREREREREAPGCSTPWQTRRRRAFHRAPPRPHSRPPTTPTCFKKSFCRIQLPHKSVNVSFTITNIENKLTDLCGN